MFKDWRSRLRPQRRRRNRQRLMTRHKAQTLMPSTHLPAETQCVPKVEATVLNEKGQTHGFKGVRNDETGSASASTMARSALGCSRRPRETQHRNGAELTGAADGSAIVPSTASKRMPSHDSSPAPVCLANGFVLQLRRPARGAQALGAAPRRRSAVYHGVVGPRTRASLKCLRAFAKH
jgi:hypothetical protein